jgi:integrase
VASYQDGQVFKIGDGTWAYRYRNLPGRKPVRPQRGGFESKGAAGEALRGELDRLGRIRRGEATAVEAITLADLVDRYLAARVEDVRPKTTEKLKWLLGKATAEWGAYRPDEIPTHEITAWRARLAERRRRGGGGHHFEATQALKQALAWAVENSLAMTNPAAKVRNPAPTAGEIAPFESWDEIEALCIELDTRRTGPVYAPAVTFAAATGLRPAEWIGLEWRNVDLDERVAYVENSVVRGERTRTKTKKSRRAVPLSDRAIAALEAVEPRQRETSSRFVFTTATGKPIDLHVFRFRHWNPAVENACLDVDDLGRRVKRPPYALRHTFATFALRAGLSTFELARIMGTSVDMIDKHYGHLARDSHAHAIAKLNALDAPPPRRPRRATV